MGVDTWRKRGILDLEIIKPKKKNRIKLPNIIKLLRYMSKIT